MDSDDYLSPAHLGLYASVMDAYDITFQGYRTFENTSGRTKAEYRLEEAEAHNEECMGLLCRIMLNELDNELAHRGHPFVRYADDAMIFCKTKRAAERTRLSISKFIEEKLFLKKREQSQTCFCYVECEKGRINPNVK